MEEWYKLYIKQLNQFPKLDDSWFLQTLEIARRGSGNSRNIIIGSSLWIVVNMVRQYEARSNLSMHELIEEGNSVIEEVFDNFTGHNANNYRDSIKIALKNKWDQYSSNE